MNVLTPDRSVPAHIKAFTTYRYEGGVSLPPYDQLNLAMHVDDHPEHVLQNRRYLASAMSLPNDPVWLSQCHGIEVVDADALPNSSIVPVADASISRRPNTVLAVLTADCLPVLITNRAGSVVLAVHAGWKGVLDGMLPEAIRVANEPVDQLCVWIGPGIGAQAFEIGDEVREAFIDQGRGLPSHFQSLGYGKWLGDLVGMARWQLTQLGVGWIGGGHWCTYTQQDLFYSYRRQEKTGRMASLIWMDFSEIS